MKVKILGTEYEIISVEETNDNLEKYPLLKDNSGYTDITTKQIYILEYKNTEDTFKNLDVVYKKTLRHELIHAFLYESGLFNNSNGDWAKNEEVVDWIAIQFEKLLGAFIELQCIDSIGVDVNIFDRQSNNIIYPLPINDPINSPKVKVAKDSIKDTTELINEIGKSISEIPIKINPNYLEGRVIGGDGC